MAKASSKGNSTKSKPKPKGKPAPALPKPKASGAAGKSASAAPRKPRDVPAANREVPTNHNVVGPQGGLTDQQRTALLLQAVKKVEAEETKKASIIASIRNIRKQAKADGISREELDYALFLRKVEPEKASEQFAMQYRVARWLAHPIGTQASLFADTDYRPAVERAFEEGRVAGLEGLTASPPYDASTPAGQKWLEGWHDGQAVLAGGIKAKEESAPSSAADDDAELRPRFLRDQEHDPLSDAPAATETVN